MCHGFPCVLYVTVIKKFLSLILYPSLCNLTYIYIYIYIYTYLEYTALKGCAYVKSTPGIEPGTSCVKSENVVTTATTPTPLALQFYTIFQKLASPVNIFMCTELNTTGVSDGWPSYAPRFHGAHISGII